MSCCLKYDRQYLGQAGQCGAKGMVWEAWCQAGRSMPCWRETAGSMALQCGQWGDKTLKRTLEQEGGERGPWCRGRNCSLQGLAVIVWSSSSLEENRAATPRANLNEICLWIDHGWTNCSLWAKSSLLPAFINTLLLEHSHTPLFAYYLWLLSYYHGRVVASEIVWAAKPKICIILPFTKKIVVGPWNRSIYKRCRELFLLLCLHVVY